MTIVLYGATGYTGRLVMDELARRGLDQVLSGRNADKLARLADERGVPATALVARRRGRVRADGGDARPRARI